MRKKRERWVGGYLLHGAEFCHFFITGGNINFGINTLIFKYNIRSQFIAVTSKKKSNVTNYK
jgi:hypothetical protein